MMDKRSNMVRLLGRLATEVTSAGEPLWYTGDTSDLAPQIEAAMQEYVDETHSKTVAVLPLTRSEPGASREKDKDDETREIEEPPFGALIVEQIEDAKLRDTTIQRINVVARHSPRRSATPRNITTCS